MTESTAKQLRIIRRTFKAQITRFNSLLTSPIDQLSLEEIQRRLQTLDEGFKNFDNTQLQIESSCDDESPELNKETEERAIIESSYFSAAANADRIIKQLSPSTSSVHINQISTNNSNPNSSIRLPKIDLPTFDGSYEKWKSFYDTFKSIVHDNLSLPPVQKLHYLRSSLKDKAAKIIQSLEICDKNYNVAWELLKKRFDHPRFIIQGHVKALLNISAVTKGSQEQLELLLDTVQTHMQALTALERPTEQWDDIIIGIVTSKLDRYTHQKWEEDLEDNSDPTLEDLLTFLRQRCRTLETTVKEPMSKSSEATASARDRNSRKQIGRENQIYTVTQERILCPICKGNHKIYACESFQNLSTSERVNAVKSAKLCFNCLRGNHQVSECKSQGCKKCNNKHNSLLHRENNQASASQSPATNLLVTTCLQANTSSQVILSTAKVNILDSFGKIHQCRAFLDPGSQANFMTEKLANSLKLPKQDINIPVIGFNQVRTAIKQSTSTTILSRTSGFSTKLTFLITSKVTETLPSHQIDRSQLLIPKNLKLADPEFHKPADNDIILGAEWAYRINCIGQYPIKNQEAVLQKTLLGWIVTGKLFANNSSSAISCNLSIVGRSDMKNMGTEDIHDRIKLFWELEEVSQKQILSREEKACESHFQEHVKRDIDGRYIVKLPFNNKKSQIGESYSLAARRFYALERKLNQNSNLKEQYSGFLQEYEELGHMSEDTNTRHQEGYYLPHHAVIKETSLTTKIRVVFDGSAKTASGISLNDALMTGPTIQDDIFSLVCRFRTHTYVLTADIEKMYRQIKVDPEDAAYQRILWRNNTGELKTYKLNTVTYGTASAPYLAIRCLHQTAEDEAASLPTIARVIKEDFYVDDLLTGTNTFEEAVVLRDQLIATLSKAGFSLRQWASNDSKLLDSLQATSATLHSLLDPTKTTKTLGVHWHAQEDYICYTIALPRNDSRITKRIILSQIAQLFDPLGLITPVIITAKMLMQRLWLLQIDWDESVPLDIHTEWQDYKDNLTNLNYFFVPRQVTLKDAIHFEIHGFCDASERAYAACIYLRSSTIDGSHSCKLLCAKSKVAPLKSESIPRLELCSALLLSRLYKKVIKALRFEEELSATFWSDSTITLQWINTPPHTLKTFIANRVAEIQGSTNQNQWRHVPTRDNPADIASRGVSADEFIQNSVWIHGPEWLQGNKEAWPERKILVSKPLESRPLVSVQAIVKTDLLTKFSSINKLQRVMAYCLRFINNLKNKSRNSGYLTTYELKAAMDVIVKLVQEEEFRKDIYDLQKNKRVSNTSKLISLAPFVDENGILRVGGRLQNSNITYTNKHPAILPQSHHVTTLIIRNEHLRHLHSGAQATLYAVRQRYWISNGRSTIRRIIHKCIKCRRVQPTEISYLMGNLPSSRTCRFQPFLRTGIDYCGPFYIKEKRHRNRNKVKIYVAIFVCFVTTAVHIELVSDLTTEAFIAALKRFTSRRDKPADIYSDNATNFVGANRELKELYDLIQSSKTNERICRELTTQGITWHFIPPRAPHFGGIWESAVKSFKFHLRRSVGDTLFTYEEFNTYVIEIEAILNSRPLSPLSSDPNDLLALTPSHFLIGDSLTNIPEQDVTHIKENRLSTWQHIQQMKQHFWKRWHREYLSELNGRNKWNTNTCTIKIGTLVILREDNLPPMRWVLGRITAVHPGPDNVIRVITVKTSTGMYKRSLKSVSPLFADDN